MTSRPIQCDLSHLLVPSGHIAFIYRIHRIYRARSAYRVPQGHPLSNVTPSHHNFSLFTIHFSFFTKKAPLPESFFHLSNKIFLFPAALSPSEDEADAAEDFVGRLSQPYAHKAETAHNAENIGE